MREIFVENCKKQMKLTKYLTDLFPNMSVNYLYKALRNKDIKINNIRTNKDLLLNDHDKLTIYIDDKILFNLDNNLEVIYKDDNVLAVFKKQGILSNNEYVSEDEFFQKTGFLEPTLDDIVIEKYQNAKICHRLDRNTAGIVIFALNDESFNELNMAFKNGYIEKNYIAYVSGANFEKKNDILQKYILKDTKTGYSKIYDNEVKNSKKIVTEYSVIDCNLKNDYAVLNVLIHTGKTHQIRAQMSSISHPIIGDQMYGKNEINRKFKIFKQLLFAYKYKFSFKEDMKLYYMNKIVIELEKSYYLNKLGSGFNEQNYNLHD